MKPTGVDTRTDTDAARTARVGRVEQLRTLADDHAALAWEFHALHEEARAVYRQDELSGAERRAQITAIVHAEAEVLEQAQHLRDTLQRLVREHHWQPSERLRLRLGNTQEDARDGFSLHEPNVAGVLCMGTEQTHKRNGSAPRS